MFMFVRDMAIDESYIETGTNRAASSWSPVATTSSTTTSTGQSATSSAFPSSWDVVSMNYSSIVSLNDASQMNAIDNVIIDSSDWPLDNSVNDPLWTAILMTILYVLILVTGVIGNVLTCVVIARNRYMHTATNYYLFSLAISDLLLLVLGLPQEIYQIWRRYPYAFGEAFCILRGFSSEASTNSSVLTITAFTMERYVAICHPLRAHTMSKLSRATKLIVIIWLLGFLCAAPIAYQFGIVFEYINGQIIPDSAACNIKRPVPYLEEHIFALQSLIVFVLPVTWISVLYTLIGIKLRQSSKSSQSDLNARLRRRPIKRFRSVCNQISSDSSLKDIEQPLSPKQNETMPAMSTAKSPNQNENNSIDHESAQITSATTNTITPTSSASTSVAISRSHYGQVKASQQLFEQMNVGNHQNHQSTTMVSQETSSITKKSTLNKYRKKLSKFRTSTVSNASTSTATSATTTNSLSQRRAVIKMLTAVVVAFFVCFAPFHAQRLMAIYVKNPSNYETIAFILLTYISGVTYYLSATINPILYSIMSVRFRQAFHDTFVRTFCSTFMNTTGELHHHGNRFSTKMPSMINHHTGSHHQKNDPSNTPPYRIGYTSYTDPMKRKIPPKNAPTSKSNDNNGINDINGNNLATRNDNKQEESTKKQTAFNEINNNNNNNNNQIQNHNGKNNSMENKLNHFKQTVVIEER